MNESKYPKVRNIDGLYFRVERDGKWVNRCWTDMTKAERDRVSKGRSVEWWQSVCEYITDTLRDVCDVLDLMPEGERE